MLINLTNHPSSAWGEEQRNAAIQQFGAIEDMCFPNIPPDSDTKEVEALAAAKYAEIKLKEAELGEKPVIHVAGEQVYCFLLIQLLLKDGFRCITSTTERDENKVFHFKRFRRYKLLSLKKTMKKNNIQLWGVATLVSITVLSLVLDYAFRRCEEVKCLDFVWICLISAFVLSSILLILSLVSNYAYINPKEKKMTVQKKLKLLIENSFSGSILDISFIIYFILSCEWIPNALMNYAHDGQFWHEPVIYIGFFVVAIITKPFYSVNNSDVAASDRKVLVTGMSSPSYSGADGFSNLRPLLLPFGKYKNIEKVVILLSTLITDKADKICAGVDESHELYSYFREYKKAIIDEDKNKNYTKVEVNKDNYNDIIEALSKLIKSCVKQLYPDYGDFRVIISNFVDYNNFKKCQEELRDQMLSIQRTYKDEEILVNITSGTSTVAGVMTINAIKGNRGLVYTTQPIDKSKLEEFNPDVLLFNEYIDVLNDELKDKQLDK